MTQDSSINHVPAYASPLPADHGAPPAPRLPGCAHQRLREHSAPSSARYHTASNLAEAAAQAINAGVDVSMTPSDYQGFTEGVLDRRPQRLDLEGADRPVRSGGSSR